MKIQMKFAAAVALLLVVTGIFGNFIVRADEAPMFGAYLEYSPQGWVLRGVWEDFPDDAIFVKPMCSVDGETYQECGQEWDLRWLGSEDEGELAMLCNQRCLFGSEEPLKSYLAKGLDRFSIKLRIVREGGIAYETQAAVIDRGKKQPVPKGVQAAAIFAPSVSVREGRPPKIQYYGRCQITISEDEGEEEVSAFLPDTLPVTIQLQKGLEYLGDDTIDCPIKWKPLKLPKLTAGERVSVPDAAEEIVIPAGAILKTQTGIYQLDEAVGMQQYGRSDEVRLVLNVVAKDAQPTGTLSAENYGLELSFHLKPTGAASIRAYTFTEGDAKWTEILGLSLTDAVNTQHSTANSGFSLVLGKGQEPYRSYWKAEEAGEEPTPFLVGIKIEGGVYDGRQLVLAWPDTYELPPKLPQVGGSGGNEGNAGSDDKDDSTEGGQRPGLPAAPKDGLTPDMPAEPEGKQPGAGLQKGPVGEDAPFIVQEEIPEIEMLGNTNLQNKKPGVSTGFFGQRVQASYKPSEAASQPKTETDDEGYEEGIPGSAAEMDAEIGVDSFVDVGEDAQTGVGETVRSDRGGGAQADRGGGAQADRGGGAQADKQEKPDRRNKGAGSRALFLLAAIVAGLACVVTIVSRRKPGVKLKRALHKPSHHKTS